MILNVYVGEQHYPIEVDTAMLREAEDFFSKMDADMDKGWQMSRDWVQHPNTEQRCQIAADKLLSALGHENRNLAALMAAYIMARLPQTNAVIIDTGGEMQETQFYQDNVRPLM